MPRIRDVLACAGVGVVAAASGCGARPLVDQDTAEQREPVQLAAVAADQSLWDISVDATGVYYALGWHPPYVSGGAPGSDTAGAVRRVPRAGGEPVELWQGQGIAYGVGAGASAIYFITYEYSSAGRAGNVWSVPRAGGHARVIDGWSSHGSSIGFAVDGDAVYWGHSAGSGGALNRTDAVDATTVALLPQVSSPVGLATDGDTIFFVSGGLGSSRGVFGMPATGGPASHIIDSVATDWPSLAVPRGSQTLIGAFKDAGVVAVDLADGRVTPFTSAPARAVVTDDAFAYWVDVGGGQIVKAPLTGCCAPTTLVSGLGRPVAIAVDDRFVYWVDQDAHAVMRAGK